MIPPPAVHASRAAAPQHGATARARSALAIERADLAIAPPLPSGDPAVRARAILADPIFVHDLPPKPQVPSLWDRFWSWVGHWPIWAWLREPFRHIAAGRVDSNAVGYAGLAIAALLLIAIIARLVLRLPALFARANGPADVSLGATRNPFADAEAAAQRGEFTAAIAATFSAALYELDRDEIVPFDASRTPGEYRRAVRRAAPSLEAPFAHIASAFVLAVYGDRRADAATWNDVRDAYTALRLAGAA